MYTKEQEYGSDGKVYIGSFVAKQPDTFPQNSDDVPDIKDGYEFYPGSYIYVVENGKIFMWDDVDKIWVEQ